VLWTGAPKRSGQVLRASQVPARHSQWCAARVVPTLCRLHLTGGNEVTKGFPKVKQDEREPSRLCHALLPPLHDAKSYIRSKLDHFGLPPKRCPERSNDWIALGGLDKSLFADFSNVLSSTRCLNCEGRFTSTIRYFRDVREDFTLTQFSDTRRRTRDVS